QPVPDSAASTTLPNLASALRVQSGSTTRALARTALDTHLAFAAAFLPTARIFFASQLLATNGPRPLPVTVATMSSTNASTFASIVPASPLVKQSPVPSAFVKPLENLNSAALRQPGTTVAPLAAAFEKHLLFP